VTRRKQGRLVDMQGKQVANFSRFKGFGDWKKLLRQQACECNMPWSFWLLHMLELGS
jgi:hypothetical protein